jgi:hypothetical protein
VSDVEENVEMRTGVGGVEVVGKQANAGDTTHCTPF